MFRNKKRLVKFVLVEEHQILVPCPVHCAQLDNTSMAIDVYRVQKEGINLVWNKQPVLIVKKVKFHQMMVHLCATCAKTDITKRKKVNRFVKFVTLVDLKKCKYLKVIQFITNVLNAQMEKHHKKAQRYVVPVVLDKLSRISFVLIVIVVR
jgi:hypothetical protein